VGTKEKELNLWRAFTEHGMQPTRYQQLAQEYQEEQQQIQFALDQLNRENREYIANLDAALMVIAQIGERFGRQDAMQQRDILRQIVGKVVIDTRGTVLRLELLPPFTYVQRLADEASGGTKRQTRKKAEVAGNETSSREARRSFYVPFGEAGGIRTHIPEGSRF
jgi:hypothetical protein